MSDREGPGRSSIQPPGVTETTGTHRDHDEDSWPAEFFKLVAQTPATAFFAADGERFLFVSPGFALLTEYDRAELLSLGPRGFFADNWPHPAPSAENQSEQCSTAPSLRFEAKITTRNSTKRWIAVTAAPTEQGGKTAMVGTVVDITEYKEREEALRRSEMRYRKVFEFAPDGITIFNTEGQVIDANPESLKMLGGYSREEAVNRLRMIDGLIEEERSRFAEIREQTLKHGEWAGQFTGYKKDGQALTLDSRVKVADLGGETVVISIARDITERKRMEEQIRNALLEKEMLLREIHHRVKNNMQIISTLLKLQLGNAEDDRTRALFRESQNRILSMAMIHEKLYQSEGLHKINLNDYLADLAEEVFASFGEDSDRIAIRRDVEDISLGIDTAIPCGLIVIELLSNALKYAFPENRRGEIFIGLHSLDHNRFQLAVGDNGVGLPSTVEISRLKSLGLRLVSDLAKYQLEGELDVQRRPGTTVHVRFGERFHRRNPEHA